MDGSEFSGVKVRMWPGVLLALLLAGFAFVSSFDALRIVFRASGMSPDIAWMGPLCVDGIVGLCTMSVWWFKKLGVRSTWYPWAGFLLFGALSVVGNMLHSRPVMVDGTMLPDWAPPVIMSIPPVAFMYATHLLVIVATRRLAGADPSPAAEATSDADDAAGEGHDAADLAAVADPAEEERTPDDHPAAHDDAAIPARMESPWDGVYGLYRPTLIHDLPPMPPTAATPSPTTEPSAPAGDVQPHAIPDPHGGDEGLAARPATGSAPVKEGGMDPVPAPGPAHDAADAAEAPAQDDAHGDGRTEDAHTDAPQSTDAPAPTSTDSVADAGADAQDSPDPGMKVGGHTVREWSDWATGVVRSGGRVTGVRAQRDGMAAGLSTAKRHLKTLREIGAPGFDGR